MKIVVLDALAMGRDLDFTPLSNLGELTVHPATAPEEVLSHAQGAEVLVLNKVKLNSTNLPELNSLKLICLTATGYDNVDVSCCRERGIGVANVRGYSTDSVAQLTLACALSLYTHLPAYRTHVTSGAYSAGTSPNCLEPTYHEIAGKTWGIVGLGNVGLRVAHVAEALGCRVIAYTRTPKPDYPCVGLDELCASSDIISLHTPLTEQTCGLIGAREIALMRKGTLLINEARGAVVDEAAVAQAVLRGQISFASDVYSSEPFSPDHPFYAILGCENVCLTPHMAWGAYEARVRCLGEVAENIRAYAAGESRSRIV